VLYLYKLLVVLGDYTFEARARGLRLLKTSPAFNGGNNAAIPINITTDVIGLPRIQYGIVDMGAYETNFRWYVDSSVYVGSNLAINGASWIKAYNTFQAAVIAAVPGDTIWVAKGTYQPFNNSSFSTKTNMVVYGGFIDTATVITSRDWINNQTILKGSGRSVVYDSSITGSVIDGFVITGGTAAGFGGGGMYAINSSLTITNCTFRNNTTSAGGGAIHFTNGSIYLSKSIFTGNSAGYGGAIRADLATGNLYAIDNVFYKNSCSFGGGGAISFATGATLPTDSLLNNVFAGNIDKGTSGGGGGALNLNNGAHYIVNNTFYADSTGGSGGATRLEGGLSSTYNIFNNIYYKCKGAISFDDLYNSSSIGVYTQSNNTANTTDPSFISETNLAGADGNWMTVDDGLRLATASIAIDAGSNAVLPGNDTTDITGAIRIHHITVDMGAYENQPLIYTFIGSGNWSIAGNWLSNELPPATLTAGYQIIIDPSGTNECVLDVPQIISTGASITISAGKKFRVPGDVHIQ